MNEPRLYVVDLSTGEVTGGPEPGIVQHCNSTTEYEMIVHPYAPDECDHCAVIREIDPSFSRQGTPGTPPLCPFLSPRG